MPKFGRMLAFKTVLLLLLALPANAQTNTQPSEQFTLRIHPSVEAPADVAIDVETRIIDPATVNEATAQALSESNVPTILSSDESEVLKTGLQRAKQIALLPFGKAIKVTKDAAGGVNQILRNVRSDATHAFTNDKLGLMIFTVTTGTDVFRWIHIDEVSVIAKTSAVLYILITNTVFAVDPKSWERSIKPFETAYQRLLKLGEEKTASNRTKKVAVDFLSNLSLTTSVNLGFATIISADRIAAGTFEPTSLVLPTLLGVATTAARFSWLKFNALIDENTHPKAKAIARLFSSSRSVTMAMLASSAMLLNYSTYGPSPWITLTTVGLLGLPLYLKANVIADWIERNPVVQKAANGIARLKQTIVRPEVRSCSMLFAPAK